MKNRSSKIFFAITLVVFATATVFVATKQSENNQNLSSNAAVTENFHLECGTAGTEGQIVKVNNTDSQISYSGPWSKITDNASSAYNKDFHIVPKPRLDFAAVNYGAYATFNFTGNKVTIGSLGGTTRGKMDVYIDNVKVDSWNQNRNNTSPIAWQSPVLSCGTHVIKVSQSDTPLLIPPANRPTFHILLDYFSYTSCTPNQNRKCIFAAGGGANLNACTSSGSQCPNDSPNPTPTPTPTNTTATPTPVTTPTPTPASGGEKCQGNFDPPAECFSCKKDSPSDQVNILDFSCFSKWYGKRAE